jgi:1-acyl-sn-glycerol-3-phosphate acyltransferase
MADAFAVEPRPGAGESLGRTAVRASNLFATVAGLIVEASLGERSPHAYAERARRTATRILDAHGVEVCTVGPRPSGAAIVVCNHLGYLDPLVVSTVVPCVSVAKGETRTWPLIGRGLEGLGVLFVRRGDAHSGAVVLRRAIRALRAGIAVLNFPEGTTSDGTDIGPFRRGIFGVARLAGVPIVPARVTYDDPRVPWTGGEAFAPHYARLVRVGRLTATLRFGEALAPGPSPDGDAHTARALIASLPSR